MSGEIMEDLNLKLEDLHYDSDTSSIELISRIDDEEGEEQFKIFTSPSSYSPAVAEVPEEEKPLIKPPTDGGKIENPTITNLIQHCMIDIKKLKEMVYELPKRTKPNTDEIPDSEMKAEIYREFINLDDMQRLLLNVENSSKFLEQVKGFVKKYNILSITDLNEQTVVLCFQTLLDCEKFQAEVTNNLDAFNVIREPESKVEFIIHTNINTSEEDLKKSIERITNEEPQLNMTVALGDESRKIIHFEMTPLSLLKMYIEIESFMELKD